MSKVSPPRIKWLVEPSYDEDGVQRSSGIDQYGREHPDPTPLSPPVGLSVNEKDTLHESIRNLVRQELFRRAVEGEGFESFEESEDFDVEDDYFPVDPHTPWEAVFDPPPGGEVGKSPEAAPRAPNGENRAPEEATRQPTPSDQKVSEGLVSETKSVPKVEMPSVSSAPVVPPSSGSKIASGSGRSRRGSTL